MELRYLTRVDVLVMKSFSLGAAAERSFLNGLFVWMQTLMYQRVRDAQIRSRLSNELMIYHMQVSTMCRCELVHCLFVCLFCLSGSFMPSQHLRPSSGREHTIV